MREASKLQLSWNNPRADIERKTSKQAHVNAIGIAYSVRIIMSAQKARGKPELQEIEQYF